MGILSVQCSTAEAEEPGRDTLGDLLFKCVIKEDGCSYATIDLLGDFSVGICGEATHAPSNFWSLRSMEMLPLYPVWWSPLRQGFLGKEKLLFFFFFVVDGTELTIYPGESI